MSSFTDPRFIIAEELIGFTGLLDLLVVILLVLRGPFEKDTLAIVTGILGVWHVALAIAYGFWIGSSAASKDKDDTIARLSSK